MITLFCVGYLLFFALLGPGRSAFLLPRSFFFGLVLLPLLLGILCQWGRLPRRLSEGVLKTLSGPRGKRVAFSVAFLMLGLLFFIKFPLKQFNAVILFDDFTSLYGASLRGMQMLREGILFGWDDHLLGGYYTVSDVNFNLAPFLAPFLIFGAPIGYHLMILTSYLLFPYLLYRVGCLVFKEASGRAFVFLLASLFTASFFRNILFVGMVDNIIGLDLFLLTLLCFERTLHGKRFALLFCVLCLVLCAIAHLGYFVYAIAGLFLRSLLGEKRGPFLLKALCVAVVSGIVLLPYLAYFLEFRPFFVAHDLYFSAEAAQGPAAVASRSLKTVVSALLSGRWLESGFEGLKGSNYLATSLLSFPILLYLFFRSGRSRPFVILLGILLAAFSLKFSGNVVLKRVYFLLPILLSLILADWLTISLRKGRLGGLFMILPIFVISLGTPSLRAIPHTPSFKDLYPKLYETLQHRAKGWVLLESDAVSIRTAKGKAPTEGRSPHVHLEIPLALETGSYLLASPKDGYHSSVYRGNALMSGIFRDRVISEVPQKQMKAFLKQWGVRSIAVWSRASRDYFQTLPGTRQLWEEAPWTFFEFRNGDGQRIVSKKGRAELLQEGYTRKKIRLSGVPQGDTVLLRMNFFPGWRGFFQGREIPLRDEEGQLAFDSPTSGDGVVELHFQAYRPLYLLSGGILLGLLGITLKRRTL